MTLLDFQLNNNGFTYIQKSSTHSLSDYRKHLVKLHNVRRPHKWFIHRAFKRFSLAETPRPGAASARRLHWNLAVQCHPRVCNCWVKDSGSSDRIRDRTGTVSGQVYDDRFEGGQESVLEGPELDQGEWPVSKLHSHDTENRREKCQDFSRSLSEYFLWIFL